MDINNVDVHKMFFTYKKDMVVETNLWLKRIGHFNLQKLKSIEAFIYLLISIAF
mgnify:CR=1 FL=1